MSIHQIKKYLFYAAQAEFAKHNTKRSTSDFAVTSKGRYSGKFAFSELLVCDEYGGKCKRKTVKKKDCVMH